MSNPIFSTLSSMAQVKSDLKAVLEYIPDFQKMPLILPIPKIVGSIEVEKSQLGIERSD